MEYSIIINPEAELDLAEIFDYYQRQREGLGLHFVDKFEQCLQKLLQNPFHTLNVGNNIRRIVTPIFPYNIYYIVLEHEIVIYGVLHQARKPDRIFKRLKN
ncbi:MAG TPA: type II toxin-antitoxin system RelE/ParE family toxin [Segetibacter sp.]|jgi:plasmid stabilization system protein ParE